MEKLKDYPESVEYCKPIQPPSLVRRLWEGIKNPSVLLMLAGSVPVVGGALNNLPEIGLAGWGLILAGVYLELVRRENHFLL